MKPSTSLMPHRISRGEVFSTAACWLRCMNTTVTVAATWQHFWSSCFCRLCSLEHFYGHASAHKKASILSAPIWSFFYAVQSVLVFYSLKQHEALGNLFCYFPSVQKKKKKTVADAQKQIILCLLKRGHESCLHHNHSKKLSLICTTSHMSSTTFFSSVCFIMFLLCSSPTPVPWL